MADASNLQTDFRGGEWSQTAQGHMSDKEYPRGLNVCNNAFPMENGPWNRRPGTRFLAYTLNGAAAWLVPFHFAQNAPYVMELTDSFARFFSNTTLVFTNDPQPVTSVSTANPAVVTTAAAHGWATNDQVEFLFSAGADVHTAGIVIGRQFVITVLTSTTFSISDPVTAATIDGSTFTVPFGTNVARVLALASPYTVDQLQNVNWVQDETLTNNVLQGNVILLHNAVAPQNVVNTTVDNGAAFAQFTLSTISFIDGPYFDPPTSGTLTPSGLSGTITLSGAPSGTFASTDVGRLMRLFSEPALWASGTGYVTGNIVKYSDGNYYTALANSTGAAPNTSPTSWAINTTAAQWVWGKITAFTSSTQVSFAIDTTGILPSALLYTTPIVTWRMGLYSATTGYPTCGVSHEGRLWLGGALDNRFDGSMSNQPFTFSPSAKDGTVADNNAIGYIFNSDDVNPVLWMTPDGQGILAGTAAGEWLINASAQGDPMTPTSTEAKRVSKYKCANVPPVRAGFSILFVQDAAKRLLEYIAEFFSGRFLAQNMTERGRHLTGSGIAQLAYQQDLSPNVWCRMIDGTLAGLAYKRESSYSTTPPVFAGWHRHSLGSGRIVEAIVTGPSSDGSLETMTMVTNDPAVNIRHVELLTDMFDETTPPTQPFFVDNGFVPTVAVENAGAGTLQLWGGYYLVGKTVSASIGGYDVGDFVVAADGSITVPLAGNSTTFPAQAALTDAYITSFLNAPPGPLAAPVNQDILVTYPAVSQPYVQVYLDKSVVTGATDSVDACNDWQHSELYLFSSGNASTNGINVFDRYSGVRKRSITATALFATMKYATAANYIEGPFAFSPRSGYLYWGSDLNNFTVLRKLKGSTLTFPPGGYGYSSLGKTGSTSGAFPSPRSIAVNSVWAAEKRQHGKWLFTWKEYLITCGNTAFAPGVYSFKVDDTYAPSLVAGPTFSLTENRGECVTGEQFVNDRFSYANVYVVGHPSAGNYPSTAALGIYKVHIPANADQGGPAQSITMTRAGGVTPAQVDATWVHFTGVSPVIFDHTDGNIMFFVQTTDSVTNKNYLIKVNTSTAAVMWATAVSSFPADTAALNQTFCGSGTVGFLLFHTGLEINTATGTINHSTVLTGVQNNTGLFSDDRDGQIFFEGGYTSGGGAPAALNSSPNVTNEWCRLGIDNWGLTTYATVGTVPEVPMAIGYTYTSQGQRLRPVEPAESGARNGPGFAKTRRNQKAAMMLVNATGISIGTQFVDLGKMRTVELRSDRVNLNPIYQLFSGVVRIDSGLDDDNSFDGMIAWQITRPWPCIVTAVGGFLHCQDI